jgi:hypothetical protein
VRVESTEQVDLKAQTRDWRRASTATVLRKVKKIYGFREKSEPGLELGLEPPLALDEHMLDRELLQLSALYAQSRTLFLNCGGSYRFELASKSRSIMTSGVIEECVPVSPVYREVLWCARSSKISRQERERADFLFECVTPLFHEQNHRILWRVLPAPANESDACWRKYLVFCESVVVALDYLISMELGKGVGDFFGRVGCLYYWDSAQRNKCGMNEKELPQKISLFVYAVFCALTGVPQASIVQQLLHRAPSKWVLDVVKTTSELSRGFVNKAHLQWQERYLDRARRWLGDAGTFSPAYSFNYENLDYSRSVELGLPIFRYFMKEVREW